MPDLLTTYIPHRDELYSAVLADVLDGLGHRSSALPPSVRPLRPGDVLVATTNGDRTSALWGELLSTASRAHGAVGVVLDGLTRDAAKILDMDFPVFAS